MARPRSFNKDKALEAARNAFWKKGYEGTSIADLEEATGLKRTSIYAAFGNKQKLYMTALKEYQKTSQESVQQCLNDVRTPMEKIRKILERTVSEGIEDPEKKGCFIVNASTERYLQCPTTTQFVLDNKDQFIKQLKTLFQEAKAQGELSESADENALAEYVFTLNLGLTNSIKNGMSKQTLLNSIDLGMKALL